MTFSLMIIEIFAHKESNPRMCMSKEFVTYLIQIQNYHWLSSWILDMRLESYLSVSLFSKSETLIQSHSIFILLLNKYPLNI